MAKMLGMQGIRKELLLLQHRWHIILSCLALQYVHGIFTQLAYRMHRPAQHPLHDLGFATIPELPAEWRWASEALFAGLLLSFIIWTFAPLVLPRTFSCVLLWTRLLTVLVVCQSLRIISFSSTQLPGPAPHCRLGTATAFRSPAMHWWQHLVVDVKRQLGSSCGDLIFSSHMTFVLLGVLSYQHYGGSRLVKALAWAAGLVLTVLIISARKHYTVDVVIAWYTVPLVYCCLNMYWHRQQQRQQLDSSSAASMLYSACCTSDSCSHGVCASCGGLSCSCSCYSPHKKLPRRSRGSSPTKQLEMTDVDASAVITFKGVPLKLPLAVSVEAPLSGHTPHSSRHTSSPAGWSSRLAAVWAFGHRRAGSDAGSSTTSSSSSSSTSHNNWCRSPAWASAPQLDEGGGEQRGWDLV